MVRIVTLFHSIDYFSQRTEFWNDMLNVCRFTKGTLSEMVLYMRRFCFPATRTTKQNIVKHFKKDIAYEADQLDSDSIVFLINQLYQIDPIQHYEVRLHLLKLEAQSVSLGTAGQ